MIQRFCAYLMRIGNGQEKTNSCNKIEIPNNFVIPFTDEIESLNLLFNIKAFPLQTNASVKNEKTSKYKQYIIFTSKLQPQFIFMTSLLELRDLVLELHNDPILVVKLLTKSPRLRLKFGNTRGYSHGSNLPSKIQLVVRVRRNDREYFIGKMKVRPGTPATIAAAVQRHLRIPKNPNPQ
ncbi:hypothetical protein H5410_049433 [Solanum commersonii]|uniref:Uncharacterized protein n=1 Tax=Solanum commersonii TaxID=4109 RepID=A0A9J5WV30_SOLCO|nr:hypothetical protein H5410_049433 [Solanum commersonii]